jgi:hypothetical protein
VPHHMGEGVVKVSKIVIVLIHIIIFHKLFQVT